MTSNNNDIKEYKLKLLVSDLITDVLLNKISVQEALSLFPHDCDDINIKCAFDALVHREADEDLRKKEQDYALVQDEFLEDIATTLKNNQPLAQNIISQYLNYHKDNIIGIYKTDWKTIFKKLKRMINF